jgi:hypothetical protein
MRPLLLTLTLSSALALLGISPSAEPAATTDAVPLELPKPTRPQPPKTAADELLRTALAEVLKEPREAIVPRQGPVLVRKDGRHVSARIIPPQTDRGVALVTAEQLAALGSNGGPERYYFLTLRVLWMEKDHAVVDVTLLPAVAKGEVAMCCWSVEREYRRTAAGWTFQRVVGGGVI